MELDQRYNAIAPSWQHMLEKMGFPAAYRALAQQAPPKRALHLIDVGAGSGELSQAYCETQQRPLNHVLLDRSEAMLAEAQKTSPTAALACEDLANHFPSTAYDVVLCAHVIEHCASPLVALKHISRMTAPGGTVLLAVSKPHMCQFLIWIKWRHKWFAAETVVAMAQQAGLKLTSLVPFENGIPARISQGYVFTKPVS
ncbi:MAG: class I SAM-dependent methyltransferase [Cognatishimia sp.]|uniref:class I SAM-dependent methyltransferase n=1 Tax=Cognatishimia sp. TaxID=2211648 RepID=UPI003B8DF808